MALQPKDLKVLERKLNKLININCGNPNEALEALLEEILQELKDTPQIESLNPVAYCEDGVLTGFIAFVLNEETGVVTPIYFDAAGAPTTLAPTGTPCTEKTDYKFKFFEKEVCLEDGSKVTEVLCIVFEDGVEINTSAFWIVDGVKVETDPGVAECVCKGEELSFKEKYDVITSSTTSCTEVGTLLVDVSNSLSSEPQGANLYRLRWSSQTPAEDQQIIDWLNAGYYVTVDMPDGTRGVLGGTAGFIIEAGSPGSSWGIRTDHTGQDDCNLYPTSVGGNSGGLRTWTAFSTVSPIESSCKKVYEKIEKDCDGNILCTILEKIDSTTFVPYTVQGDELQDECPCSIGSKGIILNWDDIK